jgi:curved DNA-binding protein CbpA
MYGDYYKLFGLDERADPATIKKVYYALCKRYHPDAPDGDAGTMVLINRAYEVLSDPIRRAAYDHGRVIARRESLTDLLNYAYSYKPSYKARQAYVPEHLRRPKTRLWVWMTNVSMASA